MQTDNTFKYIIYTLLALLFLVPFIVDATQLFPFITGKAFVFRILSASIFFVWLALAIRNPEYRPRSSIILISTTAFVLIIGIANVFGQNPFQSFWSNYERMEGYVNILHLYAMFIALGSTIKKKEDWDKVIILSLIISIGILFEAFQQHFGQKAISQGGRLDATFGNPIYLAVYNLFHFFFCAYLLSTKNTIKESWQKGAIIILAALHLFVMYETITRGAVLGLIAGIIVVLILNAISIRKESVRVWKSSLITLGIILALIASFFAFKDSQFVQSNVLLSRFAEISLNSGTSEARILNWGIAFEGFKERPILGWGLGNYSYVFDKYYDPAMFGNETWFDHVHNIVLDWLIAGGVIGLALYLLILASLAWAIWRNKNYSHLERNIFLGLIVAYFAQNLFVFDNQTSYIYFFLLLAIFHSQQNRELSIFKTKLSDNAVYASTILVIVLLPVTIYSVNAAGYFASRDTIAVIKGIATLGDVPQNQMKDYTQKLIEKSKSLPNINSFASFEVKTKGIVEPAFGVMRLPDFILTQAQKQEYMNFAITEMIREVQGNTDDTKTNYVLGLYLTNLGDYKNADLYLRKAVELSPNKQPLLISLAFNSFNLGQKEEAIEIAKKAYELADGESEKSAKYDLLWVDYARVVLLADKALGNKLIQTEKDEGRYDRVEILLQRIIKMTPDNYQHHINLALFYAEQGKSDEAIAVLQDAKNSVKDQDKNFDRLIEEIKKGKYGPKLPQGAPIN